MKNELHNLVLEYRSSGKGRELILERVAALVYNSHAKYGFDDEDDAANALLRFRGRIDKLVDRFEDRGLPFDAYLASCLRYLARTVRRDRRRVAERATLCERAAYRDPARIDAASGGDGSPDFSEARAEARPYPSETAAGTPSRRRPRARGGIVPRCQAEAAALSSRIVFLAIKCAWEMDEEGVERAAESAGVSREWLAAAVEQARRSLEPERARVDCLVERRNASWTRLRLLEARASFETDSYRKERLALAMERERRRSDKVKAELATLRTVVPNSVVARILGVPKGTVDSGLYYLRKRLLAAGEGRRLSSDPWNYS